MAAPCSTPALAVFDGEALPADYPLGGATVRLRHPSGVEAYYAHLRPAGRAHGPVRAGQVIGALSNTGNANKRGDGREHADECHLHLALGAISADGAGTLAPWEVLPGGPSALATLPVVGGVVAAVERSPWLLLGAVGAALLLLGRR